MKILCITHADFETPGVIESWAHDAKHHFKVSKPYREKLSDNPNDFDILIIMGGPQSPLKLEQFPYLADEVELIQQFLAQDKKVLGFCLGAQLIGEALGATTERSPEKEIGVYPITLTQEAATDPLLQHLPTTLPVIHWHNDMPGITETSTLLAFSAGCPRQIIRYKKNVYGFQCHLEITHEGIHALLEAVPGDLKPSTFTQTKENILTQDYASINNTMIDILNTF
jgi:GMP synthase (glutamine-hydrolysing)